MAEGAELDLYADDIGDEFSQEVEYTESDLYDDVITASSKSRTTGNNNAGNGASINSIKLEEAAPTTPSLYNGSAAQNQQSNHSNSSSNLLQSHTSSSSSEISSMNSSKKPCIYVGNLTWWTTDEDVTKALNSVGVNDVVEIKFFENRANGQSKGFCVVTLSLDSSIRVALEKLPKIELYGQAIAVTMCNRQNLNHFEMKSRKPGQNGQSNSGGSNNNGNNNSSGGGGSIGNSNYNNQNSMGSNRNYGNPSNQGMMLSTGSNRPPLLPGRPGTGLTGRPTNGPLLNSQPRLPQLPPHQQLGFGDVKMDIIVSADESTSDQLSQQTETASNGNLANGQPTSDQQQPQQEETTPNDGANNDDQSEESNSSTVSPSTGLVLRPRKSADPRRPQPSTCLYSPHCFCYICGKHAPQKSQRKVDRVMKGAYETYFGRSLSNLDKPWTPTSFCGHCAGRLDRWYKFGSAQLEFAVPVIWREPKDHTSDCYFCAMPNIGIGFAAKRFTAYPWHVSSVDRPVPHDERRPVPQSPMYYANRMKTSTAVEAPTAVANETANDKNGDEAFINMEPVLFNAENFQNLLSRMQPPLLSGQEKTLTSTLLEMNLLHLSRRSGRNKGYKRKNYAAIETAIDSEDRDQDVNDREDSDEGARKKVKDEGGDFDKDPEYIPSAEERASDGKDSLIVVINLICPVENCSKRLENKHALDEHLEEVHYTLKFRCLAIACAASFVPRRQLVAHIEANHKDPSCWVCGRCNVVKNDYAHLRYHINFHHQMGHMRCGFAGCSFESLECSMGMVRRHLLTHREPIYRCTFVGCGKTYVTRNALARHLMIHNNDRRYQCTFCEKAFYSTTDLSRHILIHKGEKPHQCDTCSRRFTLKGSLDKHQKRQNHFQNSAVAPTQGTINAGELCHITYQDQQSSYFSL